MVLSDNHEKLLQTYYYDKGYTIGRDNLYRIIVKENPTNHPTRREVMAWLKEQELHQLYRGAKKSAGISSFRPIKPLNSLSADLIDFTNKKAMNYGYILVIVDNFSRFMWARAITRKQPSKVAPKMEDVLDEIKKKYDEVPKYIQTDDGGEFKGEFLTLLKSRDIKNERTLAAQPWSNALVERANGKLKMILVKNEKIKGGSWFDNLQHAVDVYNDYTNRSTKYSPKDAIELDKGGQDKLKENVKKLAIKHKTIKPPDFIVGQKVRKKKPKGKLDKASSPSWSPETYKIAKVIKGRGVRPTKYILKTDDKKSEGDTTIIKKRYTYNDILAVNKIVKIPSRIKKKEVTSPRRSRSAKDAASQKSESSSSLATRSKKKESSDKEYVIEKILDYDEDEKLVKVKWEGYKKPSWEPLSEFKNKQIWKDYKKKNKIK